MGLERTVLPTSWGRNGPECLNLTVPCGVFDGKRCHDVSLTILPNAFAGGSAGPEVIR